MAASPSTDASLIASVRAGEPAGWERLVGLYGPLVYAWCRRAGLPPEDAADVCQDVMRSLHSAVSSFQLDRERGSFRGWLRTITVNRIRDVARQGRRRTASIDSLLIAERPAPTRLDSTDSTRPAVALVRRSLSVVANEFQANTWNAFWLVAMDGKCPAEAAQELGISVGAVHTARWRVIRRLREYLSSVVD